MIQRFSHYFRDFHDRALSRCRLAGAAQTPAAPAAPAAPARGPAGPPVPCGPGVTGKNIASDSRCFELRTYTVKARRAGLDRPAAFAFPRAHQPAVPQARHDDRRLLAAEQSRHGKHAHLRARVQRSRRARRRMEGVSVGSGMGEGAHGYAGGHRRSRRYS